MSRYVDLDERVTAQFYDQECEEWTMQTVTIEDVLDSVCDKYTALPSAEPETHDNARKTHACVSPCDECRHYPPSSADGKPCSMCPAEGRSE